MSGAGAQPEESAPVEGAILWQLPVSHYVEKARWALDHKGVAYERREVMPGLHAIKARRLAGQTTFPVLEMEGRAYGDSRLIIAALEERLPDPPLYPADRGDRERALEIADHFDRQVGHDVRRAALHESLPDRELVARIYGQDRGRGRALAFRLGYPLFERGIRRVHRISAESADRAYDTIRQAFSLVAREAGPSGYLAGDRFSLADLTAAALLSPLVQPPEFPYRELLPQRSEVPGPVRELWTEVAATPGFRWVEEIYRRHRGVAVV